MIKILALFSFLFFAFLPANGGEDEIRIGQFIYKTKRTKVFLKDEGYNAVFYSLYTLNGVHQAGVLLEAKRNDSLFISGNYSVGSNKFITRNYYHIKQWYDPDSSMKVFVQNAKGKLELTSFVEYHDGKVINQLR
jgi:hypothetical protein